MIIKAHRAIFLGMAIFFTPTLLWSAENKKPNEPYKEIISKAHNLVLQKDRQQALILLSSALRLEKPGSRPYKDLRRVLSEIAHIFLSDKTQQLYELALSLKLTDLNQAQQKASEALRMEPDNFTLILELARLHLTKNDCKLADETADRAQKLYSLDEGYLLVQGQIDICRGDLLNYQKSRDLAESPASLSWTSLDLEKAVREKNWTRAKELLVQLKKLEKDNPEISYWAWRIDNQQKISNPNAAQRYIVECRNMPLAMARRLNLDPWLCQKTSEVEAFLKNQAAEP